MNVRITSLILVLLLSQMACATSKDQLNVDAVRIGDLIRKSSEPDIYGYEIQKGIKSYTSKLSKYSNKDIEYLRSVCKLFIDLDLAVWDGLIASYDKYGTTMKYLPKNDSQVKKIQNEIKSYGIKIQQENEIPGSAAYFEQMGSSIPKQQFLAMLVEIRMMMRSDYYKVYNVILY